MADEAQAPRGQWGTRAGFILAAAGSAVGLGNIWKFPYITGENGGGLFVLIYLACIAVIGLPIMIGEVIIGRRAQRAPVGAFGALTSDRSPWRLVGWMGVLAGFIILSYYSVVAGWTMNYVLMSVTQFFDGKNAEQINGAFGTLYGAADINLFWHAVFMLTTIAIVLGGIQKGIEAWSRILMPTLFVMMVVLLATSMFQPGFGQALSFVFSPNAEKLTAAGILEALGHSFFTLSLGMGALLTYGSYLPKDRDVVGSSALVSALDTLVALIACLILFPIIFSFGMQPEAGPGLVFKSMPLALSQIPGGSVLTIVFFVLLFFAALSSAISLLEVVASTIIDQMGWSRRKSVLLVGGTIFLFGVPSAMAGSGKLFGKWAELFGKNFFDTFDYLASNWLLPLGGLFIAIFVGWIMKPDDRREEFTSGTKLQSLYPVWLVAIRFVAPAAILVLWLFSVGIIPKTALGGE